MMNTTTTYTSSSSATVASVPATTTNTGTTTSCHPQLPTHIQVQQLNSNGAYYMIHGEYDMAIDDLIQALKLWETIDVDDVDNNNSNCNSNCCSIDDCILQQQQQREQQQVSVLPPPQNQNVSPLLPLHHHTNNNNQQHGGGGSQNNNQIINSHQYSSRYCESSSSAPSSSRCGEQQHHEDEESQQQQQRFVYSRPIFTTSQFWRVDCIKPRRSNTLSLILILNLAMAHHLSAIYNGNNNNNFGGSGSSNSNSSRRSLLQKALQLYELAHQLQLDETTCSPMATMIIANNVGEIHLSVNNINKHTMCMNHLLSTMMFLIDNKQAPTTTSSTSTSNSNTQNSQSSVSTYHYWDGFLRNVSQLILKSNCAPVA